VKRIKLICLIVLIMLMIVVLCSAKSIPKAMLMSAVIPGSGELYAGSLTRGVFFITVDAVLLFSARRMHSDVQRLDSSFRQFAYSKAGIPLNQSYNYYELLHKWYSSDLFNQDIELYFRNLGMVRYNNPNYYNDLISQYSIPVEDSWQWETKRDWSKYKEIRRNKNKQLMNKNLAIGAAIANRVISVLDSVFLVRNVNRQEKLSMNMSPDFENNGAVLSLSLEF